MISHTAVNANGFVYCTVYQSPFETTTYHNDNVGFFHAMIYLIEGNLDTYPSDTEVLADNAVNAPLREGELYDIRHTRGKYVIAKTGDVGASMVMFNPIPADRQIDIKIMKDAQTFDVDTSSDKVTIVCLTGPVDVNGKTLDSMKFARVYKGKAATVTMKDGNICALVTQL